jgi:anti-sigma B factor antagonist
MLSRDATSNRSQSQGGAAFGIVQRELDDRTSLISVEGELDLSTAPRLKWMLVDSFAAGRNEVVVDLSRTSFMDSTALGVLVGVRRRLAAHERLVIVCASPELLKIFEYAGMDGAFAILPTLDEALAHVRATLDGPLAHMPTTLDGPLAHARGQATRAS